MRNVSFPRIMCFSIQLPGPQFLNPKIRGVCRTGVDTDSCSKQKQPHIRTDSQGDLFRQSAHILQHHLQLIVSTNYIIE